MLTVHRGTLRSAHHVGETCCPCSLALGGDIALLPSIGSWAPGRFRSPGQVKSLTQCCATHVTHSLSNPKCPVTAEYSAETPHSCRTLRSVRIIFYNLKLAKQSIPHTYTDILPPCTPPAAWLCNHRGGLTLGITA